jgi:anti-sigma factor RsiW
MSNINFDELAAKLEKHPALQSKVKELKAEQRKKTERIALRLAKAEKLRLAAEAEEQAKTLSSYIRHLIQNR